MRSPPWPSRGSSRSSPSRAPTSSATGPARSDGSLRDMTRGPRLALSRERTPDASERQRSARRIGSAVGAADRVAAVPADGRAVDRRVHLLLRRGALYELDHPGQVAGRVHVDDARAAGQEVGEGLVAAGGDYTGDVLVEARGDDRPMVKAVTPRAAVLGEHGRPVLVLLNEL